MAVRRFGTAANAEAQKCEIRQKYDEIHGPVVNCLTVKLRFGGDYCGSIAVPHACRISFAVPIASSVLETT